MRFIQRKQLAQNQLHNADQLAPLTKGQLHSSEVTGTLYTMTVTLYA